MAEVEIDLINTNLELPTAKDFKSVTDVEHVLLRPGMYIGNVDHRQKESWVLLFEQNEAGETSYKANYGNVTLPDGVERLYLEILSNSGDNVERSRRNEEFSNKLGTVDVIMDKYTITIRNGGAPLPIEIHNESGKWLPEFIFGTLRTSSNYTEGDTTLCGTYGYGAKLSNIFSKNFKVSVLDATRNLKYEQSWENNMSVVHQPIIEEYKGKTSVTEISYTMDFGYFHMTEYTPEAFYIFALHLVNVGFIHRIPVTFNGHKFSCANVKDYAKLMFGEEAIKKSIVHYEWPKGVDTVKRNGTFVAKDKHLKPLVEMCVIDTPDNGQQISFVNGMQTKQGGGHVNSACKAISSTVLTLMNERYSKSKTPIKLNIADVKPHLTIIVNVTISGKINWVGQTKDQIGTYTQKIAITDNLKKKLLKWDILLRLKAAMDAKTYKTIKKTDGRKRKHIKDMKGTDANDAGTSRSLNCTVLLTEGDSASEYADKWISFTGTQDTIGVFPLGGKPLNAMKALESNPLKLYDNKVFQRFKDFLGLREGLNYLDDENYKTLRYGHIMILADADVDGNHIKGLVLLYIRCCYPSLLQRGVVYFVRTPIIRVTLNDVCKTFYSLQDYENWKTVTLDYARYDHEYFKGLASSTDDNIREDIKEPKIVSCVYDDLAPLYFDLAFGKARANDRKKWLAEIKDRLNVSMYKQIPISTLIDHEIIEYSHENNVRSIPNFIDGLKPSQRKSLYYIRHQTKGWSTAAIKSDKCKKKKVGQMMGYISAETGYHHGEDSLGQTIIKMAQSYTGANNLPYFTEEGQFGSRKLFSKGAGSPRYIFFKPQRWLVYVYREEDVDLYDLIEEEGETIEPHHMLPIIPMHLINGTEGIGSAWKTFIPPHDVEDVYNWLIARLTSQPLPTLIPYYKGFTGNVEYVFKQPKTKKEKPADATEEFIEELEEEIDDEDLDDELVDGESEDSQALFAKDDVFVADTDKGASLTLRVTGTFEIEGKYVKVTEIPIGRSIHSYTVWLEGLIENKEIKDFRNMSTHDKPLFYIEGFNKPNEVKLKLVKNFGLTSMVMMNGRQPIQYNGVSQVIESFYQSRLPYYQERKNRIISKIAQDIDLMNLKIRFIMEVAVHKRIIVLHKKKADIIQQMAQYQIPADILDKVKLVHCTVEEIDRLKDKVTKKEAEHQAIVGTMPEQMWVNDLFEFITMYRNYYK